MKSSPARPPSSPPVIERFLDVRALLKRKSHFLFGPRQTGKTFLVHRTLKEARFFDLLDSSLYLALSQNPGRLAEEMDERTRLVVIDEIQRLPVLLNEVHRLIERRGIRFLLTGSSASKLRRGGVNLLGGRARTRTLHPLTSAELGSHFDLERAVERGTLPSVYFSDDPAADLASYSSTYLQQEVVAEGLTRNAPAFSRFLHVAGLCNGTVVNFTKVANDAQVKRTTVYQYFEVLRDTLIIHELPGWRLSRRRKPLSSSKYYFFDVGVAGALQGRPFKPRSPEFGQGLETFVMHELLSWRDYVSGEPLCHWRSTSGFEVDFLIGDHTALEIKAGASVSGADLRSLRALADEKRLKRFICACLEKRPRTVDGISILPVTEFLERLWAGEYR